MKTVIAALISCRTPEDQARGKRDSHRILPICQCKRRHGLIKQPIPNRTFSNIKPVNQKTINVGPVERLLAGVPYRPFAAAITDWGNTFDCIFAFHCTTECVSDCEAKDVLLRPI